MIDENQPRIPCWLVWSTSINGLVTLESISLTPKHAEYARRILLDERYDKLIDVKIEKSECNHMFAGDLDEIWWKLYGEQAEKRTENTRVDMIKGQLNTAIKLGEALIETIKIYDEKAMIKAASDWIIWNNGWNRTGGCE